ncbi:hypothetical protein BGZ95_007683 [Linnemannia exigua]|uniref:Cyclin-domain-containing protein n=1 Tax=Linnemannia exigua TaxID=604196 RepID=A0AAD4DGL5_9FUNG|nr:hypothetical protein BGZ95_007683 [Linnemannia exigua]
MTSSANVDAQITPGRATPAPTPKMTAAPNGFRVNSFNIHRLLITCLMVAAKFTSDLFYSNARYAKVGGLSLPELNQLELVFLFTTQFDLNVKEEELQRVGNALLRFKLHRETTTNTTMNTTTTAPVPQPSLPAPPAAIAAQVARTLVVVSNGVHSPSSNNLTTTIDSSNISDINAPNSNSRFGDAVSAATNTTTTATAISIANAAAVTAGSSSDMVVDPRHQPPRTGRFSIPSPTSPKTGPMSDRGLLQKPISSLPSSSSSSTSSSMVSKVSTTVSSTATASLHSTSSAGQATTVVASGALSQPPQLLSPPEEKHGGWTEGDVDVQMTTPVQSSSALSSSIPSRPN